MVVILLADKASAPLAAAEPEEDRVTHAALPLSHISLQQGCRLEEKQRVSGFASLKSGCQAHICSRSKYQRPLALATIVFFQILT